MVCKFGELDALVKVGGLRGLSFVISSKGKGKNPFNKFQGNKELTLVETTFTILISCMSNLSFTVLYNFVCFA